MDPEMTLKHLAIAREHVALGEKQIAQQRAIVSDLAREGQDPYQAQAFLRQLEKAQDEHISHRDRLEAALAKLNPSS